MKQNLLLDKLNRHITEADLLSHYGDKGRVFSSKESAIKFQKGLTKRSYVSKLVEYNNNDIRQVPNRIGSHLSDATPYCKGYLVTIAS